MIKKDKSVLFKIDMELYNEFNEKLCEINEHLGKIYSYQDLVDLKEAIKDTEIKLLRQAIKKQEKEIEELKKYNKRLTNCHFKYEEITGIDLLLESE